MKRSLSVVLRVLFLAFFAGLSACSVKEDRDACPCKLLLDFSSSDLPDETIVDLNFISTDGFFNNTSVVVGEERTFLFEVPRTDLYIQAFYGDEGFMQGEKGLVIPESRQCPEIYMEVLKLDTRKEAVKQEVKLYKNYCNIEVCFQGITDFRYDAMIDGRVCGYDLEGDVAPGHFNFMLFPDEEGHCMVRVPRQSDASLVLKIQDVDGYMKTFALGEYIIESGFDWKSPDLKDVLVHIDYAHTQIVFTINDWQKTVDFDVII